MSRELIESIVSNNMLEANDMVEAKMAEIRERKMYEMKRMFASEAFGGLTKQEIEDRRKAGYKKASDVLGDPREKERKSPRINPGAKIIKKKVSESVEVQPDPEGRIRGGEPKKKESRFSRAREKIIKKGGEIGGNIAAGVVGKAFDVAHGMAAARKLRKLRKQRKERDAARAAEKTAKTKAAPDVTPSEPSFPKHDTPGYKPPRRHSPMALIRKNPARLRFMTLAAARLTCRSLRLAMASLK